MNILHLSTNDTLGAGRATYQLHKNFKAHGHNSKLLVLNKTIHDDDIIQFSPKLFRKVYDKVANRIIGGKKTNPDYYFFNYSEKHSYYPTRQLLKHIPFNPDLIIVGWVSKFINTKNFYELNKITSAPIFWYAMDMAPLTGGCHYAWDCEGYKKKCGNCPAIYSKNKKDVSFQNFRYKSKYIEKTDLTFISGTTWLTQQAEQSKLFANKKKTQILIGIDNEIFKPFDKSISRKIFNVPIDKKVILIGATNLSEKRKGIKYLIEALDSLANNISTQEKEKIFLLIIGNDKNDMKFPFAHKYIGFLNDDRILALAYQAADVFVCSSIEDSGPMMINESIMCGTPVVAFEMGVAPDLVHTGKTGYCAKLKDSEDMAKGIGRILSLNTEEHLTMSENCRELGINVLHPKIQVESFEKIYYDTGLNS